MKKSILVKIRETNPNFPVAEYLAKLKHCDFVDSVSGIIDGLAKLEVNEYEQEKLMDKFNLEPKDIEPIIKTYETKSKKGLISFWLNFKVKKEGLPKLESFIHNQSQISEAYLTKNSSVYIKCYANSMEEVDKFWQILYKEVGNKIDKRIKPTTYFVFRRFTPRRKKRKIALAT